jgi:hypothetical protein
MIIDKSHLHEYKIQDKSKEVTVKTRYAFSTLYINIEFVILTVYFDLEFCIDVHIKGCDSRS